MSAVRSAASSAAAGAAGKEHLGRHFLPPLTLDHKVVDVLHPTLPHRLGHQLQPIDDAGLLLHDPSPPPRLRRHRRLRGDVARAHVLRQRPRHQLLKIGHSPHPRSSALLGRLERRVPLPGRLQRPRPEAPGGSAAQRSSGEGHPSLTSARGKAFNPSSDQIAPVPDTARRVRPRCNGRPPRRRRPHRRRGLLPRDLPGSPARLPQARQRRQPARLAADDRPPQGDRPSPRPTGASRCRWRSRPRSRSRIRS